MNKCTPENIITTDSDNKNTPLISSDNITKICKSCTFNVDKNDIYSSRYYRCDDCQYTILLSTVLGSCTIS